MVIFQVTIRHFLFCPSLLHTAEEWGGARKAGQTDPWEICQDIQRDSRLHGRHAYFLTGCCVWSQWNDMPRDCRGANWDTTQLQSRDANWQPSTSFETWHNTYPHSHTISAIATHCRRQQTSWSCWWHYFVCLSAAFYKTFNTVETRGQSNLTKSASRGADSPVRGHPRGSKVVSLNSWGRVSY